MPSSRVSQRRRSSLASGITTVRAGKYGVTQSSNSPRNVTFAPNVTPGTYNEPDGASKDDTPSPVNALFPPSQTPAPAPTRRRAPPGKRRSQGYIPRPPNAFMLFRADFVHQRHIPGSIEATHGTLSKIIGNLWHALPLEEKRTWENLAKKAKAEHRQMYPDYRFRPVHKKKGEKNAKKKGKIPLPEPDERRCEDITEFLIEGMKGDELAAAVRQRDMERSRSRTRTASPGPYAGFNPPSFPPMSQLHQPTPIYAQRRSSSVPPPSMYYPIVLPSVPFFGSRAPSPVGHISRSQRIVQGHRRASSVQPIPSRSWTMPMETSEQMGMPEVWQLQRDWSPLPEPDMSLFQPEYTSGGMQGGLPFTPTVENVALFAQDCSQNDFQNYDFNDASQHQQHQQHQSLSLSISPLDAVPVDLSAPVAESPAIPPFSSVSSQHSPMSASFDFSAGFAPGVDGMSLGPLDMVSGWAPSSGPSSTVSGSPALSETSLPMPNQMIVGGVDVQASVLAPQPMHAQAFGWSQQVHEQVHVQVHQDGLLQQVPAATEHPHQGYAPALEQMCGTAQVFPQFDSGMFVTEGYVTDAPMEMGLDDAFNFHQATAF
ncbi:uncharacterized protein LAESUDRAFT_761083 [Laetiporus sulphureus 93-53]|uniref:HMG box domain-containing protein n=1 Tax=Laetiporus sulphureus 93-53 TaxID=1314785 RepID=A0A165DBY8_9APHY|nr:uncharacterized protein LAESUDRAFT_761083 [Laetiporus sulphureus 93-53]KZT04523.1 hypothetical protein LAESUDRAFT_761083 [Laetiporus sulphureus 93-53]